MNQSYLNWLPLSDRKNITIPEIIIEEYSDQRYGGCYCPGNEFQSSLIVAVLRHEYNEKELVSRIAHEFRHHIQSELRQKRGTDQGKWARTLLNSQMKHEDMLRVYYRTQENELDALLYEHKHAKTECNDYILNHIVR